MADASVGSKNGINNKFGKNMVGTFFDCPLIIVCVHFLKTLDLRNMRNGFAEIIKMACILDKDLFEELESIKDVE
jgi:3-dehydroquinate synthetase